MRVTGLQEALALASRTADQIEQFRHGRAGPDICSLMMNIPGRQITFGMASFDDFERAARRTGLLHSVRSTIVTANGIRDGWTLTVIGPPPAREPDMLVDIESVDE